MNGGMKDKFFFFIGKIKKFKNACIHKTLCKENGQIRFNFKKILTLKIIFCVRQNGTYNISTNS